MGERKPMTAKGYTLPPEIETALVAYIRDAKGIQLSDVVQHAWTLGVPRRG